MPFNKLTSNQHLSHPQSNQVLTQNESYLHSRRNSSQVSPKGWTMEMTTRTKKSFFSRPTQIKELVVKRNGQEHVINVSKVVRQVKERIESQKDYKQWRKVDQTGINNSEHWKVTEKKAYLSAMVNKQIEQVCETLQGNLSKSDRQEIFNKTQNFIKNTKMEAQLFPEAANSLTPNTTRGNKYLMNKIKNATQDCIQAERREIESKIIETCTLEAFKEMHHISQNDLNMLQRQVSTNSIDKIHLVRK
ncbi:hypothetical protein QNN88_10235 [Citrobacter sp. ANG330]|uniref:hypothetical protein n=1 Tax=Citrobacter sp. ANG330 TaxID=3048142 RepID=UPI0039C2FAA6